MEGKNIFQLYAECARLPIAVARHDYEKKGYIAVVLEVIPDGKYGAAFGFPVENGKPTHHYSYDNGWKRYGKIPCAGCYQWSRVPLATEEIEELVLWFEREIKPSYTWPTFGVKLVPAKKASVPKETRVYLAVAYAEKDEAKALGAKWDPVRKAWYVPEVKFSDAFGRWKKA